MSLKARYSLRKVRVLKVFSALLSATLFLAYPFASRGDCPGCYFVFGSYEAGPTLCNLVCITEEPHLPAICQYYGTDYEPTWLFRPTHYPDFSRWEVHYLLDKVCGPTLMADFCDGLCPPYIEPIEVYEYYIVPWVCELCGEPA